MKRFITSLLIIMAIVPLSARQTDSIPTLISDPESLHPMPGAVGLVLSGGGAKGIAHIGVIQALEDNGIPIDCISGTSMGSIVGGLYAMGYTPAEMMQLIESKPFQYWSTGRIDSDLTYYFLQEEPEPTLINVAVGSGGSHPTTSLSSVLPSSLINPLPMNFAFIELFSAYTAQCGGDFNKLMVPFRCVASDVDLKRKAVFSRGDLGDCIRASMSFPLVFHPIEIEGRPMYDGGIYDNFPVDVMIDQFDPHIIIGVDVSSGNTPDNINSNMMDQMESLIMQESNYQVPPDRGMRLKMDLDRFGLLDFGKAPEIYQIGYDYATKMMDSIKARVHQRVDSGVVARRRAEFKSRTPRLIFDSVKVTGGSHSQDRYLTSLFTHGHGRTLTVDQARDAYYRAITPGKLSNFMPRAKFNPTDSLFDLNLKATVKNNINLGFGGFVTSTTNSMLYLSGGYRTLSFNSLDMSLSGWIGQSYLAAEAKAKFQLLRTLPSSIELQAIASRQKYFPRDRYFFQTSDPTALTSDEYFGRLTYGVAAGRQGKVQVALGVGRLNDRYRLDTENAESFGLKRTLGQAIVRYENFTLNNRAYPTSGHHYRATVQGAIGRYSLTDREGHENSRLTDRHRGWGRVDLSLIKYTQLSRNFSLGAHLDITATTDKMLPDYYAALAASPHYAPSSSMVNVLAGSFHAHQFGVIGIEPVWMISSMVQLRAQLDGYLPYRAILPGEGMTARLGRPWHDPEFFGELRGVLQLSFASVSAYTHYSTVPEGHWNFGITLGLFIPAPSFFR